MKLDDPMPPGRAHARLSSGRGSALEADQDLVRDRRAVREQVEPQPEGVELNELVDDDAGPVQLRGDAAEDRVGRRLAAIEPVDQPDLGVLVQDGPQPLELLLGERPRAQELVRATLGNCLRLFHGSVSDLSGSGFAYGANLLPRNRKSRGREPNARTPARRLSQNARR